MDSHDQKATNFILKIKTGINRLNSGAPRKFPRHFVSVGHSLALKLRITRFCLLIVEPSGSGSHPSVQNKNRYETG